MGMDTRLGWQTRAGEATGEKIKETSFSPSSTLLVWLESFKEEQRVSKLRTYFMYLNFFLEREMDLGRVTWLLSDIYDIQQVGLSLTRQPNVNSCDFSCDLHIISLQRETNLQKNA
jgi:hypothetical protein